MNQELNVCLFGEQTNERFQNEMFQIIVNVGWLQCLVWFPFSMTTANRREKKGEEEKQKENKRKRGNKTPIRHARIVNCRSRFVFRNFNFNLYFACRL